MMDHSLKANEATEEVNGDRQCCKDHTRAHVYQSDLADFQLGLQYKSIVYDATLAA